MGNDAVVTIRKANQSAVGRVTLQGAANFNLKQTSTVLTVDDVNYIANDRDSVKVTGTTGKDYITNTGNNVTIQAGKESDTITGSDLYGERFLFSYASGADLITNFGKNDTLLSTNGTISAVETVGNDAVVTIRKAKQSAVGKITLQGGADYRFIQTSTVLTVDDVNYIENDRDSIKVTGTTGKDYITNSGANVTIQAGKSNDTIDGSIFGEVFMFSYAAGNNVVTNFGANDTVRNTSGTMSYSISGDDVLVTIKKGSTSGTTTLQGAAVFNGLFKKTSSALYVDGLNVIENTTDNKKVTGTKGRDYIVNTGENVTIQAGAGDDIIDGSDLFGERFLFSYASGADTVTNFGLGDTLQSTSGTLSYRTSGNDYMVTIKKSGQTAVGTITLKDAATNYTLTKSGSNLIAKAKSTSAQIPSDDDYWFLDDNTSEESPLSAIVETDNEIDMPSDFNDIFRQSTNELTYSARHRQKKVVGK